MAKYPRLIFGAIALYVSCLGGSTASPLTQGTVAAHQGDFAAAQRIFEPLALGGNAAAQFNLGYLYFNGWGVRRDESEAVNWYRKAAEQGLAIAQYHLGLALQFGDGINPDLVEAFQWLRRSAEQGYHRAQLALGIAYASGQGVDMDPVKGYMWMSLAVQAKVEGSDWARYTFSRWMSADQIRQAQALIREWHLILEPNRTVLPDIGEIIATDHAGVPGDPTTWPVQAVGRLTIHEGNKLASFCSGVLVGPKLVLTAAHCLIRRGQSVPPDTVEFGAGILRGIPEYSSVAERFIVPDRVSPRTGYRGLTLLTSDAISDWALVQLKQRIPVKPIPIRVLSNDQMRAVSRDGRVLQIGYGADRPFLPTVARNCRLYPPDIGDQVFLSRCLSFPDYSGSPILVETDGEASVVGITSQGVSLLYSIACSASQFEKPIAELNAERVQ